MCTQFTSPLNHKTKVLTICHKREKGFRQRATERHRKTKISVSTERFRHKRSLLQWLIKALSCESNAYRGQEGDSHCQPCCVAKFRGSPSLHPASPPLTGELGYSWAGEKSSVVVIRGEQAGKLHLCQPLLKNLSFSQASWMWLLFHYFYGSWANRFRVQGTTWFTTPWTNSNRIYSGWCANNNNKKSLKPGNTSNKLAGDRNII